MSEQQQQQQQQQKDSQEDAELAARLARFASDEYRAEYRERLAAEAPPNCFSAEQRAQLEGLKARVAAEDAEALCARPQDLDDKALARFLVARKFKVDKALQMWRRTMVWRRDHAVSELLEKPPAKVMEAIKPYHPETHHGVDKFGRPIYWWRFGAINGQEIARRVSQEQYLRYHTYLMELGNHKIEESMAREHGDRVWTRQATIVVDCRGLSMGVRHYLSYFKPSAKVDEEYYPETMGPIFVVNAPSVFGMVWRLIRPMLDPVTAAKVQILGGDYRARLLEHIDEDQLLEEYGGTAKCPPAIDLDSLQLEALAASEAQSARHLDEAVVPSRGRFEHDVVVTAEEVAEAAARLARLDEAGAGGNDGDDSSASSAGSQLASSPQVPVEYYFTTDGHDISFGAVFEPEGGGEPVVLVEPARCASHKHAVWGEVAAHGPGTVRMTWDNSYSWWTSKTLHYSVTKVHGEDELPAEEPASALRHREEDAQE